MPESATFTGVILALLQGAIANSVQVRAEKYDVSGVSGTLAGILFPHALCTVFVLARVWSRAFLLRKWFLDDFLIVLAWIFSTAVCVVYSIAAETPNLRAAVEVSTASNNNELADDGRDDPVRLYMLRTYLGLIFYQLCLCLTKLSILAFYLRMFCSRPLERRLAGATVAFVIAYGVPLLFVSIFQCHPSRGKFFGRPMRCFSFVPLLIASASLHTVTDAWLIAMVAPCIAGLDLPRRQKVALAVVLSLGIFVIAASMTRLQLSLHANYRPSGSGVQVSNTLAFFVMTVIECDLALMCASAPTLRPLLARLWPRLGMGEHQQASHSRRKRRRRRRGIGQREEEADEEGSMNLTTVSYHGYPWTRAPNALPPEPTSRRAGSSGRSSVRNTRKGDHVSQSEDILATADVKMAMPAPPAPAFMQRTPTTLSLRSFMSSITPRSRGATVSGVRGEDRAILLGREDNETESDKRRRSSVGFEGYYDQYLGYGEEKRRSGLRNSLVADDDKLPWNDSQESFVLGLNDPASPSRLSPVSGFSGNTYSAATVLANPEDSHAAGVQRGDEAGKNES
ncbi:hypothetical protein VTK73DRAFT_8245 [Phialemonium thermophilum]|uniref:Rhodopsin domain-containing protein n=1 Tax=Phialemonium thermophilum TaxID=223376 RepID=A0ABR3XQM6_9PEZI